MGYPYFGPPFGRRAERVNLYRSAGVDRPLQMDTLKADCRGRDMWRFVIASGTDGSEGKLYSLTYRGGHLLPLVRYVKQQCSLLAVRGDAGILSVRASAKHPEHGQRN